MRHDLPQLPKESTYCLSEDPKFVSCPLHARNGIRAQVDAQWRESQWQQNQRRIDLKGIKVVKTWRQKGTILGNSSFEHKSSHHQTLPPTTPGFNLYYGKARRYHALSPS